MGSQDNLDAPACQHVISLSNDFVEGIDLNTLLLLEEGNIPSYGIIVLNRPISHNKAYMVKLWQNATVTLTADGGTGRWETFLSQLDAETKKSLQPPDLVTGDFDSITECVLEKYRNMGCKIVPTPDQDRTDFTKAIMEINTYCKEKVMSLDALVVITEISGRMDHIMANVNTLYLCQERKLLLDGGPQVYLMSNDSVSWLLGSGSHIINIPERIRMAANSWCALIPVGEECSRVTTTGLKWNLNNKRMKFGSLISTSNTYDQSPAVHIQCSHPLLWSMKIRAFFS